MIYLIYGKEQYLLEEKKRELLNVDELSIFTFDMDETPCEEAIETARTSSLFSEKKAVILKNCFFITADKTKRSVKHDTESIISYLLNPLEETDLFFCLNAENIDRRKKVTKILLKQAKVFECRKITNVRKWISNQFLLYGKEVSNEIAAQLENLLGNDLFRIDNEIRKICNCIPNKKIEDFKLIENENIISRTLEDNVFELINAIAKKDKKSLLLLEDLLLNGEPPIKILFLITRKFREIFRVKFHRSYTIQEIAAKLSLHPYAVSVALDVSNLYSEEHLKEILVDCCNIDFSIKTGKMDSAIALQVFIAKWTS